MTVCIWYLGGPGEAKLLYRGPRERIPKKYKESIAIIDASDDKDVPGVGDRQDLTHLTGYELLDYCLAEE
jgi:hypothetical protein